MQSLPELEEIKQAGCTIYDYLAPTPQINWPLLDEICGTKVWVKHENHLPTGSFKVRGGLWFVNNAGKAAKAGLIAATRGNHGQSIAFAAGHFGLPVYIVVPENNNPEKNAAMRAYGANVIVHGHDFDDAKLEAEKLAEQKSLLMVPSFDPLLVCGVATYALELFTKLPSLARIYVPMGLGSGICGVIAARDALNVDTEVIGVVAERANAYQLSFETGRKCSTTSADTIADGLAVRNPDETALAIVRKSVSRIIAVSESEIEEAMKTVFVATHNLAEGAGAAGIAGLIKDSKSEFAPTQKQACGVILSGGNVAFDTMAKL